jgi:hypothetical protein
MNILEFTSPRETKELQNPEFGNERRKSKLY